MTDKKNPADLMFVENQPAKENFRQNKYKATLAPGLGGPLTVWARDMGEAKALALAEYRRKVGGLGDDTPLDEVVTGCEIVELAKGA